MIMMKFIDLKTQYEQLKGGINSRIQKVLDHGHYIMGPEVRELETELEEYTQVKHCVTVASGTEALLISLLSLNIQVGDQVITTPFTFAATAEVIVLLGAIPVFIDIEPDTGNMDAGNLEKAITQKTKAIIVVSLYGQTADMQAINAIAADHGGIPVIEDAAQSFGASYYNQKSCNLSTIGCTSFFPSKPLGCYGDGGGLFTNSDELAEAMRAIRVHGQTQRYHHTLIGVGGRMDTIQCAIILEKLTKFEQELQQRQWIAKYYLDGLSKVPFLTLPTIRTHRISAWAQFTIQLEQRDKLVKALADAKIPTAVHYPCPLHQQPAYKNRCKIIGPLRHAETLSRRVVSLPMHPFLNDSMQEVVMATIKQALI